MTDAAASAKRADSGHNSDATLVITLMGKFDVPANLKYFYKTQMIKAFHCILCCSIIYQRTYKKIMIYKSITSRILCQNTEKAIDVN